MNTESESQPVVEARQLDLTFQTNDGPIHALKDVHLTVDKGDFVSFIGPSGCGKTTFLRCIAALETPTGGALTVNGMTPDEARRNRAYGYVFQAAGLYPWRTIAKNIKLPLEIMGYSVAEQNERVRNVLELVDLEGFGGKFPWQLSGGMQQRASIARALAFDADILLMDEPFGALDEIVRDHLNEQLLALWARTEKTIGVCDTFDPRSGVSEYQDRSHEPSARADHGCDRQPAAKGPAFGYSRYTGIHRGCASCPRGSKGGACGWLKAGVHP